MKDFLYAILGFGAMLFIAWLSMPSKRDAQIQIIAAYMDKAYKCGYDLTPLTKIATSLMVDKDSAREMGYQIKLYSQRNLEYTSLECANLPREVQDMEHTIALDNY